MGRPLASFAQDPTELLWAYWSPERDRVSTTAACDAPASVSAHPFCSRLSGPTGGRRDGGQDGVLDRTLGTRVSVLLPFSAATLLGDPLSSEANEGWTPWGPASPDTLSGTRFPGAAEGLPFFLSPGACHLPTGHHQEGGGPGHLPTLQG